MNIPTHTTNYPIVGTSTSSTGADVMTDGILHPKPDIEKENEALKQEIKALEERRDELKAILEQ